MARRGEAGQGRLGRRGVVRQGLAWQGAARFGQAWQGNNNTKYNTMTKSEALLDIYKKHGKLTPEIVVEEAKDKKSPLHEEFDWNNKEAGQKWRVHQARLLICRVHIVSETPDGAKTRLFVHNGENTEERTYNPVNIVVSDPGEMARTLNRFHSDCMAYVNRIRSLGEYKQHSDMMDSHINQIEQAIEGLVELYIEKEVA